MICTIEGRGAGRCFFPSMCKSMKSQDPCNMPFQRSRKSAHHESQQPQAACTGPSEDLTTHFACICRREASIRLQPPRNVCNPWTFTGLELPILKHRMLDVPDIISYLATSLSNYRSQRQPRDMTAALLPLLQ